jgi:hypothetical protein
MYSTRLKLHAYKIQLVQKITCTDQDSRKQSAKEMLYNTEDDETFSIEAVFV